MDLIYWYYLGSKKNKIADNLDRIASVIDLYNALKDGKYSIYYECVYSIKREKLNENGEELVRYWLQLTFSDDKIINSKMFRKYRHRLYTMEKFLNKKKYHKKWNQGIWDEYDVEEIINDN
jgi:cobalamin biosynthesis Mg chelatase CobN